MGSVNLDNTGSGSAITLSSDGTSLLLNGTAIGGGGGGADLYAANESSPAAQPSATGTNAIAIGDSASSTGIQSVAIGQNSSATDVRASAFGGYSNANAINSVALSFGATVSAGATDSNALGARSQVGANTTGATAIGKSYASGNYSLAAQIANNSSSYGANNTSSIAIGSLAKVTQSYSVGIGRLATATGSWAYALGQNTTASGSPSHVLGHNSSATANSSISIGTNITNSTANQIALGGATDTVKVSTLHETVGTITTGTINLATGNVFADAPSANATYVFSNPAASGLANGFTLKITPSATVTITWPTSVDWAGGTAPTAPASGATDVYTFYTTDGGTTYYGFLAGGAMA